METNGPPVTALIEQADVPALRIEFTLAVIVSSYGAGDTNSSIAIQIRSLCSPRNGKF
jgi:hypothetical protein